MYRETNEALSNKINALRFFAIFGVLYIHAENYAQFGFLLGTQGYALEQKAIGAFEWAVPLFFLLSAFLFFRGFCWNQLLPKWSRRIHSILIPYLVWSTIYFALFALLPRLPFLAPYLNSTPAPLTLSELLSSIFLNRYAGFLWFIKTLIVFTLAAPLFYVIFSRRYLGEIVLLGIFSLSIFSPATFYPELSLRWRFIFFYALGAYLGLRFPDAVRFTIPRTFRLALLFAIPIFVVLNALWDCELYSLVVIACLWFGMDAGSIQPRRIFETTFFVYMLHILVFSLVKKLQYVLLPHTELWMLIAYASLPFIAVAILHPLALLFRRLLPRVYSFLFGGR